MILFQHLIANSPGGQANPFSAPPCQMGSRLDLPENLRRMRSIFIPKEAESDKVLRDYMAKYAVSLMMSHQPSRAIMEAESQMVKFESMPSLRSWRSSLTSPAGWAPAAFSSLADKDPSGAIYSRVVIGHEDYGFQALADYAAGLEISPPGSFSGGDAIAFDAARDPNATSGWAVPGVARPAGGWKYQLHPVYAPSSWLMSGPGGVLSIVEIKSPPKVAPMDIIAPSVDSAVEVARSIASDIRGAAGAVPGLSSERADVRAACVACIYCLAAKGVGGW